MATTTERSHYKPFDHPWAFDAFVQQNKMHWLPEEVPLSEDILDWNKRLTEGEKDLLTQIFRFFTQGDVDIAKAYCEEYIPLFKKPELRMMLMSFAAMEAVHIHAYSLLLDTVGMPESEYQAFQEYEEMVNKHNYLFEGNSSELQKIAKFSAFGEGLQLFSSFAILLNFARHGKMKGMGQIVTWSIRDETLHVESMIKLFHEYLDDNMKLWNDETKARIYQTCRDMVELEDTFIDLAFNVVGELEGLTKEEVKDYVRYLADRRLLQLGLKPNYKIQKNPLPWMEEMLNGVEHANFFDIRATEYFRSGSFDGSFDFLEKESE
tara:strand:+ start:5559 stop:6521 length:963 start_codon:yes stop_codon:yes gene_type:complete